MLTKGCLPELGITGNTLDINNKNVFEDHICTINNMTQGPISLLTVA